MAPVTEIATIPLPTGAQIEDPDSHAGKIWTATIDTLASQAGYQRAYYGREVENPNLLQVLVDWDSLESHQNFIESTTYGPLMEHLVSITDGPISLHHVSFNPHPPSKAVGKSTAPVTEVLVAYLNSKDESYAERSAKFASIVEESAEACTGAATGWMIEEAEHEGKKVNAYVSVLGWQSKEKHAEFRETSTFRENIHMCRDGARGISLNHTIFEEK